MIRLQSPPLCLCCMASPGVIDERCRVAWGRLQARQRLRERREEKRREASAAAVPDPALLRAREAAASAAEAELLREEAEEVRALCHLAAAWDP